MSTKQQYREYLNSDHWKALKDAKAKRTEKRCSVCGFNRWVQLHHLTYRNWTDVETSDLRWLCPRCHALAHTLMNDGKIRFKSDNQHHRFSVIKHAIAAHLAVDLGAPNYGNPVIWRYSEIAPRHEVIPPARKLFEEMR